MLQLPPEHWHVLATATLHGTTTANDTYVRYNKDLEESS